MLIDATHPFAVRISRNAHIACEVTGTPRLTFLRPAWAVVEGDQWHEVEDVDAAANVASSLGRRAFITLGSADLTPFQNRPDFTYVARVMKPSDTGDGDVPNGGALIHGAGPSRSRTRLLLCGVTELMCWLPRHPGGAGARAKLDAARMLGIPVVLIRRPPPEPGRVVSRLEDALAWVASVARLD